MKQRLFYILTVSLLAVFTAISLLLFFNSKYNYETATHAERIENQYRDLEGKIVETISDEIIISKLITDSYTFDDFSKLASLPFGIIVYEADSAIIWTNNIITPVNANIIYTDAPLFISESNGKYVILEHDFPGDIKAIGFLPINFEYGIKNKYLSDVKTDGLNIPSNLIVDSHDSENAYAIRSRSGNPVFYISDDPAANPAIEYSNWMYVCIALSVILFLVLLFSIFKLLAGKINPIIAILLFLITLAGSYFLLIFLLFDAVFLYLPLFDPQYYGSPGIAGSTGDLLIKTVFLLCFAIFVSINFSYRHQLKIPQVLVQIFVGILLVITSILLGKVFKSLILDSSISFDIHNFFSLNYFSFFGFFCIGLLLLAYFLLALRLIDLIPRHPSSRRVFIIIILILSAAYYFIQSAEGKANQLDMLSFLVGFIFLRWVMQSRRINIRSMSGMMIWLIYFAAFSAFIFDASLTKKEEENKRLFAVKKSIEKDPISEYLFNEVSPEIQNQLSTQYISSRKKGDRLRPGVFNQVRQDFQNNYFKKYLTELYVFVGDSLTITTDEENNYSRSAFGSLIENDGERTSAPNLYFIRDNTGSHFYLAEFKVAGDSIPPMTTYMKLIPKKFSGESIYPELLIDDDLRIAESFNNFDYAIYAGHSLIEREGVYSYPLMDIFYLPKDSETADIDQNGFDHYVYKVSDVRKVIVSEESPSWLEPVSLFSYLFFFYLIFLVAILLLDFIIKLIQKKIIFREWINTSLQNKIQTSVISLIIFAFIMMGVATIYYISDQYNDSHKQRLLNKIEAVQTNIDFLINENHKIGKETVPNSNIIRRISNRVSELSEVHDMDINLYEPDGDLINSSQPDIFDKGLLSRKMNALAFFKMSCDKETWYIQTERIGHLSFLSAYVPVLDDSGETMFYLNLPYFATEQNLRAEISSFMVTLVNVYVLLLIVAGIIAFVVSRSITSPLATIAGKFKGVKLGKRNEPVAWTHNDEIGLLVAEYNKMLSELEKSAELLAKSERESAWRDMAKQVAHEIKNPLTPMRLSIQHLQRAIQTNAPNLKELIQRVGATLLEQIDNLSHIASEFSTFAVMPKAINENIVLNDVLENVVSLFKENETAEIKLKLPDTKVEVFADKNQLIRVFNNLVKNAMQAIPSDVEGKIEIGIEQLDHRVVVKVKDNGIGIAEDQKEKVFVPNFTTKSSGMGIGLAMSKNIVESAGGFIWFETSEDYGTTFFVEFPVVE